MVDVLGEARRFVPGAGEQASANAYLALTGVLGGVFWLLTVAASRLLTTDVVLVGVAGGVVLGWLVVWVARGLVAAASVDRGVWLSSPELLWTAVTALAFLGNGVGLVLGDTSAGQTLMWLPWAGAYTVGYLGTGLLVERGGVYLAAGVVSGAVLVANAVVGVPAMAAVFALLTAVPLLVDAARGGRELTDAGVPALRESGEGRPAGGVVPE
jgi:hypothetical protein